MTDDIDLRDIRRARSTTPDELRERCPNCRSVRIHKRLGVSLGEKEGNVYWYRTCDHEFDEPIAPRVATDGGVERSAGGSEHFDGLLEPDDRSPDGFARIDGVWAVLANPRTGRLVLTGEPSAFHDCDKRGCGSVEHKIAEFDVDGELFYQEAGGETDDIADTDSNREPRTDGGVAIEPPEHVYRSPTKGRLADLHYRSDCRHLRRANGTPVEEPLEAHPGAMDDEDRRCTDCWPDLERSNANRRGSNGSNMERITLRLPPKMLATIDGMVEEGRYPNRSAAIREGIGRLIDDRGDPQPDDRSGPHTRQNPWRRAP